MLDLWRRGTGVVRGWWLVLVVVVTWAAASIPVTLHGLDTTGDYALHLEYVVRTHRWPPWSPAPHPAFHLAVAHLGPFLGLRVATVVVMAGAGALTAAALVWLGRRPLASGPPLARPLAAVFALGYLVLETPATLLVALGLGAPQAGAPALHVFPNPTDTLAVPFAVVVTVVVAQWLDERSPTRRRCVGVTVVALTSMVVKPSTGLVLLAAIPLHLLATRAGPDRWRRAAAWFAGPVAVIALLQTWWVEERVLGAESASIVLRPWRTVEALGLDRAGPLLFTVLLVVPLGLWAGRRRYLGEPVVALSLWATVVGIAMLLVLAEDGSRAADGTFAKPGLMATIVLCLVSWRYVLGEAVAAVVRVRSGERPPAWLLAAGLLLAVSLASGAIAYLDAVGAVRAAFRSPA